MNTKIKHRILGILVVIALVIILLPLFQSHKDIPTETTIVKAPPFPDQAAELNSKAIAQSENNIVQPDETISNNYTNLANNSMAQLPKPDKLVLPEKKEQPKEEVTVTSQVENPQPESVKSIVPQITSDNESNANTETNAEKNITTLSQIVVEKPKKLPKKLAYVGKKRSQIHAVPLANDINGLSKLNGAAWVIQIGNYKNKTQAIQLVNRLRVKGYPAFIQQVSTAFGNSTRVFVGPEYKLAAASQLADRLEKHMHVRGIVLSYKPLGL